MLGVEVSFGHDSHLFQNGGESQWIRDPTNQVGYMLWVATCVLHVATWYRAIMHVSCSTIMPPHAHIFKLRYIWY